MKDGRANNGGPRAGAGRKSKEAEQDLHRRLGKWAAKDRDACFRKLFQDAVSDSFRTRNESRKLLFAYAFGKPVQRVLVEDDRPDEQPQKIDLSQLNQQELETLERAGEILARARRGQGGEGQA